MYSARTSIFFKRTHVYRVLDKKRNTLVYLAISDKLIEGRPRTPSRPCRSCRGGLVDSIRAANQARLKRRWLAVPCWLGIVGSLRGPADIGGSWRKVS